MDDGDDIEESGMIPGNKRKFASKSGNRKKSRK